MSEKAGDQDRAEGTLDDFKGRAKSGLGGVTGDKQTQTEGEVDRAKGGVKEAIGDVKDKLDDVGDRQQKNG